MQAVLCSGQWLAEAGQLRCDGELTTVDASRLFWDLSQLDLAALSAAFGSGAGLCLAYWASAKGLTLILQFLKTRS
ncbi:hypothetical protein [Spartinivicinus ruber]|uniref:hypothetical protein n=1 Tax=Spartinivicinus ruber TaxID=2683272 RepID=UPI0013D3BC23|nr:hypothetical protein [Spartinivicinus ruber]